MTSTNHIAVVRDRFPEPMQSGAQIGWFGAHGPIRTGVLKIFCDRVTPAFDDPLFPTKPVMLRRHADLCATRAVANLKKRAVTHRNIMSTGPVTRTGKKKMIRMASTSSKINGTAAR